MTPQERQLVDDLFARLSKVEDAPRDPDATAAITQGLRSAPNAIYALVQTVLVQDEALKQAHHRIEELEGAATPQQAQGGSFLDSMRDAIFGQGQPHGSVPNVAPPRGGAVWNSGQVLQGSPSPGRYDQGYGQNPYGQPYAAPQGGVMGGPMGGPMGGAFGGGGSFLGTAAAAAAGVVGGSLLLNSFRGMMGGPGGGRSAFGDTSTINENRNPWRDQSDSDLARDAGINDIGSHDRSDDGSRAGLFDTSSNDDPDDMDSGDFGNDNDSDYA
ncbi:MAG: DUF2076 family protein [Bradyrhizobium sp.]|nr:DUF2076 family protein [Bradyrhizobium sp.]